MKPDINESAYAGTIVVGVPPKPKRELLFGLIILTAAVFLVVSQLSSTGKLEIKSR